MQKKSTTQATQAKNPFELRTDILTMAKEYMDQQLALNKEFAEKAFAAAIDAGKVTQENWSQFAPTMYSIDDLTKKAQELYGFVSNKG
jgi:capsule polysaccharide export protein KpsE/RkpR